MDFQSSVEMAIHQSYKYQTRAKWQAKKGNAGGVGLECRTQLRTSANGQSQENAQYV